jgi:hypothetical protein
MMQINTKEGFTAMTIFITNMVQNTQGRNQDDRLQPSYYNYEDINCEVEANLQIMTTYRKH